MKPSDKQIKVIEFIEQQLQFWKYSNDINSPSHCGDISEYANNMDNILSENKIKDLYILTTELYWVITEIEQ